MAGPDASADPGDVLRLPRLLQEIGGIGFHEGVFDEIQMSLDRRRELLPACTVILQ